MRNTHRQLRHELAPSVSFPSVGRLRSDQTKLSISSSCTAGLWLGGVSRWQTQPRLVCGPGSCSKSQYTPCVHALHHRVPLCLDPQFHCVWFASWAVLGFFTPRSRTLGGLCSTWYPGRVSLHSCGLGCHQQWMQRGAERRQSLTVSMRPTGVGPSGRGWRWGGLHAA